MCSILNNRGQFSIIAALLVAVILIATVIITYSTIRYSPVNEQPPIQSAIDETNFAIKQILGFTLGYYGSVLQVTGNSSYARELALDYLQSGLVNIANMHPDWGSSFDAESASLATYWFTNSSYSMGNVTVMYNLTGLGISGISYQTSCRLGVQVLETVNGQSCLVVKTDENTPLISLGRRNFRFCRYNDTGLLWEYVNPSTEPLSYANGTYQIDVPSGVDAYSYFLEVQDPRGIVVVASSFSKYVISMNWDPLARSYYAVTGSVASILGMPDGVYATIGKGASCEVTNYQGGSESIAQVYFNITYYSNVSSGLKWYYQLDGGSWVEIGSLPLGGTPSAPLTRAFNATGLRPSWTWASLNATDIRLSNNGLDPSTYARVDAIYATIQPVTVGNYSYLQNSTLTVELLQNGTMRWLGQDLQMTTSAKPIPPLPIKAIHVNQTINGVNQEVPFQIEDWNHNYQVPAGLTSNGSLFSNRQMMVFLANHLTSKVTIWWNGSDQTSQTQYAFTNRYFTGDDPSAGRLTNGILTLRFTSGFTVQSTVGSTTSTSTFMEINSKTPTYGSNLAYIIHHGVVRDVIHQEAEWSDGIPNCPNVYSQIIITLPANTTYYTYRLRLMFVESQQSRSISELSPIKLTISGSQSQTENGTSAGYPIVVNGSGLFYNYSASAWQHHWSQILNGAKGTGLIFTDEANRKLYVFDSIAGSKTGALDINAAAGTIKLSPVRMAQTSFTYALDVTWHGAVVTFDGTTPIYREEDGVKTGLWIIAECPPSAAVGTGS